MGESAAPANVVVPDSRRPDAAGLLAGQIGYAWREFWRNPVMAFVAVGFPLVFLLTTGLAGADAGPEAIRAGAPSAAVFAAAMAVYVMMPFGISQARERGVLKRLRGTPLPTWCYLAGRVVTAVAVAVLGTLLMLAVAVAAFGLELSWRLVPAMVVTFVLGAACLAAIGLAVAAVVRGSQAVMTVTMGSFLLTAFASGVFAPDLGLPRPLDVGSWFLPLRHLSTAFADAFDPATAGAGFAWPHLAALAAWSAVGALVAARWLTRDPAGGRAPAPARATATTDVPTALSARATASTGLPAVSPSGPDHADRRHATATADRRHGPAAVGGRPGLLALAWKQARHANRGLWREPTSAFFAVAFPVMFTIVVPYAFGHPVIDGVRFAELVTPAMAVFGAVVMAYVNLPETVATARDRGILKRLRGTPLPAAAYVGGRIASVVWIGGVAVVAVFVAGGLVHDVAPPVTALPALAVVFLLGILAMAALGLGVAALIPDAKAVPAVGLGTFLPLAFISDMLAFGVVLPEPLQTIGWLFPLKHFVYAVDVASVGDGLGWGYLAALLGWGVAGSAVAVWRFRWEPR